jgi:hypothetical protein
VPATGLAETGRLKGDDTAIRAGGHGISPVIALLWQSAACLNSIPLATHINRICGKSKIRLKH